MSGNVCFQSRELRNLKALTNPSHTAARELLNDRYGITLPNIKDKKEPSDKVCLLFVSDC